MQNKSFNKTVKIIFAIIQAIISGLILVGIIGVPAYIKNCLDIPRNQGWYIDALLFGLVVIIIVLSHFLVRKVNVKVMVVLGHIFMLAGLVIMYLVDEYLNNILVVSGICLLGLGLGMLLGSPLNVVLFSLLGNKHKWLPDVAMILSRLVGVSIALPIVFQMFNATLDNIPKAVVKELPKRIIEKNLQIHDGLLDVLCDSLKNELDESVLDDIYGIASMEKVVVNIRLDEKELSEEDIELLVSSDVTSIVSNTTKLAANVYDKEYVLVLEELQYRITQDIEACNERYNQLEELIDSLNDELQAARSSDDVVISVPDNVGVDLSEISLASVDAEVLAQVFGVDLTGINTNQLDMTTITNIAGQLGIKITDLDIGTIKEIMSLDFNNMTVADMLKLADKLGVEINEDEVAMAFTLPNDEGAASDGQDSDITAAIQGENKKRIEELQQSIEKLRMDKGNLSELTMKLMDFNDSLPNTFNIMKDKYLKCVDDNGSKIEKVYKSTVNEGLKNILIISLVLTMISLNFSIFVKGEKHL